MFIDLTNAMEITIAQKHGSDYFLQLQPKKAWEDRIHFGNTTIILSEFPLNSGLEDIYIPWSEVREIRIKRNKSIPLPSRGGCKICGKPIGHETFFFEGREKIHQKCGDGGRRQ